MNFSLCRSNGVATRRPRVPRQTGQPTPTGPAVDDDDEGDDQSIVSKEDVGGEEKNSAGSEMTELESEVEAEA